jgi:DNA-binding response OmpR family regulator
MARTCVIAESDPFISRLLQRFAEEDGFDVVHAQVGLDVVELAQRFKPQVIILEPELPGKMRGWEVIQALRENQETREIPVITCSWLQDAEVSGLIGEVQGNLQKPELHYEDFVDVLTHAGITAGGSPGFGR